MNNTKTNRRQQLQEFALKSCQKIGTDFIALLLIAGDMATFLARIIVSIVTPKHYLKQIYKQFIDIGYFSISLVALTTAFTGMVLVLQIYEGGGGISNEYTIGLIVSIGLIKELVPVLSGLMLASRVASASAAEIGTMRVHEQIDAMVTLSINPIKYLIAPRVIASTLST